MTSAYPTEREVGGPPTVGDLMTVIFGPNNTFIEGEFVLVPRTLGGFTYGIIEGHELRTQSCHLDEGVRHTLNEYSVMLDESQELLKGLPTAFIGKLPEFETGEIEEEGEDQEEQIIGGKALQRDLRTMIFGLAHEAFEKGEIVVAPRSRGGFTYGRINSKQSVPCHLSDRPRHFVEGLRIFLSEDADPLRKDLCLQMLGRLPSSPGLVGGGSARLSGTRRNFPSMRLTPAGLKPEHPLTVEPDPNQVCGDCEEAEASYQCDDCSEFYCEPCCTSVHSKGNRKTHSRITLLTTTQAKLVRGVSGTGEEEEGNAGGGAGGGGGGWVVKTIASNKELEDLGGRTKAKSKKKKTPRPMSMQLDSRANYSEEEIPTPSLPGSKMARKSLFTGSLQTIKPGSSEEPNEDALRELLISRGLIQVGGGTGGGTGTEGSGYSTPFEEETIDSAKLSGLPAKKKKKKKKTTQQMEGVGVEETQEGQDHDPNFKTFTVRFDVNLRVPISTTLEELIQQISTEFLYKVGQLTDSSDIPLEGLDSIQSGDVVKVVLDKTQLLSLSSSVPTPTAIPVKEQEEEKMPLLYGAKLVRRTPSKAGGLKRSPSVNTYETSSTHQPPPPLSTEEDGSLPSEESPISSTTSSARRSDERRSASLEDVSVPVKTGLLFKPHPPSSPPPKAALEKRLTKLGSSFTDRQDTSLSRSPSPPPPPPPDTERYTEKDHQKPLPPPVVVEVTSLEGYPELSEDQLRAFIRLQGNIRRFLQIRRYRHLLKRHIHRRKVVFELLATERSFMKCLRTITEVFMTPIQQAMTTNKKILTQQEMMTIFGVIDCLADMQKRFWKSLEKRLQGWDDKPINEQCVGDLFYPPQQKKAITVAYTTYITGHKASSAIIADHLKNKNSAFHHFMQDQSTSEMCEGLGMEAFLITPVQRICRYVLLLTDLLKNTETDHPDYENITNALETTKEIAGMINEKQRTEDSLVELQRIEKQLPASTKDELRLVQPHRVLIGEGPFTEIVGKEAKRRWVILFNDLLLCTTKKKNKLSLEWKVELSNSVCVEHTTVEGGDLEIRELKTIPTYPYINEISYTLTPPAQPPQDFSFWKEKFNSVMSNTELIKKSWQEMPTHLSRNLLTEKDWATIMSNSQMITYSKDQPILHQGSRLMRFYRVVSGRVRMEHQVGGSGGSTLGGPTKTVVRILDAGEFFGEKFFVDEQILLPVHAIADSPTTVVSSIGFTEMSNMLAMYPQLCVRFFQLVCVKLSKPLAPIQQNRIVSDVTIDKKKLEDKKKQQVLALQRTDSKKKVNKISKKFKLPDSQADPDVHYTCQLKGRKMGAKNPGKLYLFRLYICFSSKGGAKVAIPFSEVKNIDIKEKSIYIFAEEPYELQFEKELPEEACLFIQTAWKAQNDQIKTAFPSATSPNPDSVGTGSLALTADDWERVYACAVQKTYNKNDKILVQGERPYRIYHISRGSCRVEMGSIEKPGQVTTVGKMQTNQMFGELCYMFGGCSKVTVIADQDGVEVYELERSSLEKIFAEKPLLGGKFYKFIAEQMASELERNSP